MLSSNESLRRMLKNGGYFLDYCVYERFSLDFSQSTLGSEFV